jgi:DNA-binding MarR family transcriptional regulator
VDEDEINRLRIALGRISRTVDRQVAGDGMTRTQLSVLGTVARERRLGIGELADIEGLNPTMTSRLVGKMEDKGLVRRSPAADDRRSVVVEITAAGARLHTRLRAQRTKLFTSRLAGLPGRQQDALLRAVPALELLAEALRRPDPDPSPVRTRASSGATA